ncbi:hypothetical protein ARMGADRAFT_1037881 [Armillaria gallica]|uniref:C2H2-type domain-containing protein n=1 Tax=Armillaria gallica TaxID=47427 RepID=A0A2H3D5B1_ARMGA|nr:hypothetical protein ARMGADRAFT_1037881 [Armillaria gallica]
MSTDMIRMDGVYCALCDEYFFDKRQRAEHIMNSNDHPECWRCGRRFLNGQILRRHCVTAPNHHYCVPCDKHCRTAAGFRVHMEQRHVPSATKEPPRTSSGRYISPRSDETEWLGGVARGLQVDLPSIHILLMLSYIPYVSYDAFLPWK